MGKENVLIAEIWHNFYQKANLMNGEVFLSVVIPIKNEEENIEPLIQRITFVLDKVGKSYEIIFIDDGSTDRSFQILRDIQQQNKSLKIIKFDQNYGQTAAIDAGLRNSTGKYIVTMDGDLQNDPRDVPNLLQKAEEGFDLVCGYRKKRKDNIVRILSSKIANAVRNKITNENIKDVGCTLKLFNSKYVKNLKLFEGMHRFLPTLMKLEGAKVAQIPVNHFPRKFGKTKYNIRNRLFKSVKDLLAVRWMQGRYLKYKIEGKY